MSPQTVDAALALAEKEASTEAVERGTGPSVTPSRLDALRAKAVLLKRVQNAFKQAQASDGPMGVLDQGNDVRFGSKTPFEAAAAEAASSAQGSRKRKTHRRKQNAEPEPEDEAASLVDLRSLYKPAAGAAPTHAAGAAGAAGARGTLSDAGKLVHHAAAMDVSDTAWQRQSGSTTNVPDDHDSSTVRRRLASAQLGTDMVALPGQLQLHRAIHEKLLSYQVTGVRWLAELHAQRCGGIIADEMGLGKTVQVTCLLGALAASGWTKPAIVVCPATMLGHWYRELTMWCPQLRVLVLHDASEAVKRGGWSQERIINSAFSTNMEPRINAVITTYETVRRMGDALTSLGWGYVVLDEGHRIRNPDAGITKAIKTFRTVHRIIVTGAPIQNKLTELWSLFDFVFPGRLGSRDTFESQFSRPIAEGSWASASALKAQTAFQCAVVLRDLIRPYLLRRVKKDVSAQLPPKTEKVIFTRLSPMQTDVYKSFVTSDAVQRVMEGGSRSFRALGMLQKLCNHPGLFASKQLADEGVDASAQFVQGDDEASVPGGDTRERMELGRTSWQSSGKLQAAIAIVKAWIESGHRVLWFTQGREMLDVLEGWVRHNATWKYMRMDGSTPVASRQGMVDVFNRDSSINVFLLTTRVGGLGVNLTGADRVLLYDPAWNPSTDAQARERAWRLGQTKPVVVYRLVSSGTIEEKVYERQIFKQLLMAKVLGAGNGKQASTESNLKELFTLVDADGSLTTPAGVGRLERISLAARLGVSSSQSADSQDALAVRVQAYNSESDSDDSGAASGAELSAAAQSKQGEAGVLAALLDGASLDQSFAGMHSTKGLTKTDRELIRATARRTAEAAAATAAQDLVRAAQRTTDRMEDAPLAPTQRTPARTINISTPDKIAKSVASGCVFGRVSMRVALEAFQHGGCGDSETNYSSAVLCGPHRVRNGFLLGHPPGTKRAAGWPQHVQFEVPDPPACLAEQRHASDESTSGQLHSSQLLASLRSRKLGTSLVSVGSMHTSASTASSSTSGDASPVAAMAARLVSILSHHENGLPSKQVLSQYGQEAFAHKHVFREVLRSVALFDGTSKRWVLKGHRRKGKRRRARRPSSS